MKYKSIIYGVVIKLLGVRNHFKLVKKIDDLLPKSVKSYQLSKALSKYDSWDCAFSRLKHNNLSELNSVKINILYMSNNKDLYYKEKFLEENILTCIKSINKLEKQIVIDMLNYIRECYETSERLELYSKIFKKANKRIKRIVKIFIMKNDFYIFVKIKGSLDIISISNIKEFKIYKSLPSISPVNDVKYFKNDYIKLLGRPGSDSHRYFRLKNKISYDDYLFLLSHAESMSEFPKIAEEGLLSSGLEYNQKLNVLWAFSKFSDFKLLCNRSSETLDTVNKVRYLTLDGNHKGVIREIDKLIVGNNRSLLKSVRLFYFWSYCYESPDKIPELISRLKYLNVCPAAFEVYWSMFSGENCNVEEVRSNLKNSLSSFLRLNVSSKLPTRDELRYKKVLILAKSGVADEVRWSRLYRHVNSNNISISCEPRLQEIFSLSFDSIQFIPHKRQFRAIGMNMSSFHLSNLPDTVERLRAEYDYVISISDLCTILEPWETKTQVSDCYIMPSVPRKNHKDLCIGILWSSSYNQVQRNLKYSYTLEEILELQKLIPDATFYSLQAPISDEERKMCIQKGIIIVDSIDLYNDFTNSALFYKSLDAVVGVSTLNNELAAATGTKFYHLANSPEISYMRTGTLDYKATNDRFGSNTITVGPLIGYKGHSKKEITKSCIFNISRMINKTY
ncbi:hypothetical protein AB4138_15795 [Vibrio sp. 10N.286.52.C3]|uniref:hypothetical protein n=1 Tax=Vibrio sp. 10N.286.52.C3 TaxID=3229713 RepID=UPI00354FD960